MKICSALRCVVGLLGLVLLGACAGSHSADGAKIAMIGDSVLAWNNRHGASAGTQLMGQLGEPVANFSVISARISHPIHLGTKLTISEQLRDGDYDIIVMNGGANDLYFECLCNVCDTAIKRLTNASGGGEIPALMAQLRAETGAQIVYTGYHRSRGLGGPYERCAPHLDIVEARVASYAARTPGITYVPMQDVFPPASKAHYDFDNIHPSVLGSGLIAQRLAAQIRRLPR